MSRPANQRPSSRERAAAVLREQQEQERRRRVLLLSGGAVLIALVVLALALAASRGSDGGGSAASSTPPSGLVDGAAVSGDPAAPVTVTLYEDYLCPACGDFERSVGPLIDELREDGQIRVEHRPVSFLDRASSDEYSTRAVNAVGCVVDTEPAAVAPFSAALFAEQPAEGGAGLSDQRLVELAAAAGAEGVEQCVQDQVFRGWVDTMTEDATGAGVTGTPTVLVDGEVLEDRTPEALSAAVSAAAAAS